MSKFLSGDRQFLLASFVASPANLVGVYPRYGEVAMSLKFLLIGVLFYNYFASTSQAEEFYPKIRYQTDEIFESYPNIEHYVHFRSTLDLNQDWKSLSSDYKKLAQRLEQLDSMHLDSIPLGKRYKIQKDMLDIIDQQLSYLILARDRKFYWSYQSWLVELTKKKPKRSSKRLHNTKLKGLDVARKMANSYEKFAAEETQFNLIRYFVINRNENYKFYLRKFLKKFPKSKYRGEALHLAGEAEFEAANWAMAAEKFTQALASSQNAVKPYTSYMLAWSHMMASRDKSEPSKQRLKKAEAAFKLAIKSMDKWEGEPPTFGLKQAAAHDLAWLYADRNLSAKKLKSSLEKLDAEDQVIDYYYYRGVKAVKASQWKKAKKALVYVQKNQQERSPELSKMFVKLSELATKSQKYGSLPPLFTSWRYQLSDDSKWVSKWKDTPSAVKVNRAQAKFHLRNFALGLHEQLATIQQKSPSDSRLKPMRSTLVSLYEMYLDQYPKSKAWGQIGFNLGNIMFELEEYNRAIAVYNNVVNRHEKFSQDAGYNSVMAAFTAADKQDKAEPKPGKKIPLSKAQKLLVKQIDLFTSKFPKAKEALSSTYTAAQLLYDYGHLSEAFERFQSIATMAPKKPEGENAMRVILSYYWEKQDWKNVVSYCQQFLSNPGITAAGHTGFLNETLEYANSQVKVGHK